MSCHILGLGTAVPAHAMSQIESADLAHKVICQNDEQARLLSVLYRKAGVKNRFTAVPHRRALDWVLPETASPSSAARAATLGPTTGERMRLFAEHASPLALVAARQALAEAKIACRQITHLVTVSCTGFSAPGIDIDLITELGLRPTTERVQVGFMGCHAAMNGLRVVHSLTTAHPAAHVLLCAVELCSLHYRFQWDPEKIVANAIFGDGAAAIVACGGCERPLGTWAVAATGSCVIPDSQDAMSWQIGDNGFEMALSAKVPGLIHQHLRPWLTAWLSEHGHRLDSIGCWAIHPGGPRILKACGDALQVPPAMLIVSEHVLAEFGNMSSSTVLFIIRQLQENKAALPCVSLAFGPGLTAEATLFV